MYSVDALDVIQMKINKTSKFLSVISPKPICVMVLTLAWSTPSPRPPLFKISGVPTGLGDPKSGPQKGETVATLYARYQGLREHEVEAFLVTISVHRPYRISSTPGISVRLTE